MPRGRSIQTMERDAQAVELRRNGLTHRQIADQLGYKSPASVHEAIQRGLRDCFRESAAEVLQLQLDRLETYRRHAMRILTGKHLAHSNGRVVINPQDDKPVLDPMPVLHALDRLVKIDTEINKLRDLYPAAKSRVEVVTHDMIEAEITSLEAELANNDPARNPGTS